LSLTGTTIFSRPIPLEYSVNMSRAPPPKLVSLDIRIGGRYRVGKKIGSGAFGTSGLLKPFSSEHVPARTSANLSGDIYTGQNVITNEEVAIKLEPKDVKHPQLVIEKEVLRSLAGGVGFPSVRWYGTENDYNAMVIDLL
jgi:casein kinase I family protein HRR25